MNKEWLRKLETQVGGNRQGYERRNNAEAGPVVHQRTTRALHLISPEPICSLDATYKVSEDAWAQLCAVGSVSLPHGAFLTLHFYELKSVGLREQSDCSD